jgi:lipopolysaccharide transport system permease protein
MAAIMAAYAMSLEIAAAASSSAPAPRRVVVRAQKRWQLPDLREAWHYRELFWVLAARDIKVRYKQTVLGVAWAILQPLATMIVFTLIAKLGSLSTDGVVPQIFYYAGMLPWLLFANSFTSAGSSLVSSQNLVTKVYFPRIIIPVASVITSIIDFGISFVVLIVMMVVYRAPFPPQMVLLPIFVLFASATAVAFGLWLAALNVLFRDVRYAAPFITQLWFFSTPVLYSSNAVRAGWKRVLLGLNPMSGVVDGFRWCVLGRSTPGASVAVPAIVTAVALVTGLLVFRRVERTLADTL